MTKYLQFGVIATGRSTALFQYHNDLLWDVDWKTSRPWSEGAGCRQSAAFAPPMGALHCAVSVLGLEEGS